MKLPKRKTIQPDLHAIDDQSFILTLGSSKSKKSKCLTPVERRVHKVNATIMGYRAYSTIVPTGDAPSSSSNTFSNNVHSNNRRNRHRLLTILGIQALVAASYFLLSSPADDISTGAGEQHRSLAELAAAAKHTAESRHRSLAEKSYFPHININFKWGEWPTWTPVQHTFRRLCTADARSSSYRRSLSLAAVDKIIPNFVTRYFGHGEGGEEHFFVRPRDRLSAESTRTRHRLFSALPVVLKVATATKSLAAAIGIRL